MIFSFSWEKSHGDFVGCPLGWWAPLGRGFILLGATTHHCRHIPKLWRTVGPPELAGTFNFWVSPYLVVLSFSCLLVLLGLSGSLGSVFLTTLTLAPSPVSHELRLFFAEFLAWWAVPACSWRFLSVWLLSRVADTAPRQGFSLPRGKFSAWGGARGCRAGLGWASAPLTLRGSWPDPWLGRTNPDKLLFF